MPDERRIYGIDLGTTYSCIAYVDDTGNAVVVPGDNNTLVTASVVYFEGKATSVVGQIAKDMARIEPNNTIELIKGYMGDETWRTEQFGVTYRPEEISNLILKKLKKNVEESGLNLPPVTDVVITVPAYFDSQQRTATKQAGELAGFKVHALIPEPTAAAASYSMYDKGDDTFLVYDLGGGTFDVTVLTIKGNNIDAVCVMGEHQLGGRLWDERLASYLSQEWRQEHRSNDDPLDDPETSQDFYNQSETAKRDLTIRETKPVMVQHGANRSRVALTRNKFEELTQDLLERTITLTRDAIEEAEKRRTPAITKILLVGGSTYMPQVRRRLQEEFNLPIESHDPDQAVAKGAALYARNLLVQNEYKEVILRNYPDLEQDGEQLPAILSKLDPEQGKRVEEEVLRNLPVIRTYDQLEMARDQVITNVCSKNFGVVTYDKAADRYQITYLIKKNDPVSADGIDGRREFYTVYPNQLSVRGELIESNGDNIPDTVVMDSSGSSERDFELPDNSKQIGQYLIDGLPANLPANSPIDVRFRLTPDGGRLTINAQELSSGRRDEVEVEEVSALSAAEMRHMMSTKVVDVS